LYSVNILNKWLSFYSGSINCNIYRLILVVHKSDKYKIYYATQPGFSDQKKLLSFLIFCCFLAYMTINVKELCQKVVNQSIFFRYVPSKKKYTKTVEECVM
jgi:hypothetical protein